jgi:hypothetical protein
MRLVGLAVAGLLLGAAPASAQNIPRPVAPVGLSSAQDAAEIVQAMGLDPIGPAARSGPYYVQSARDDFGRVLRVTVDARRSQVIAVEAGVPRALYGPYAGYTPHHRPYPARAAHPFGEDLDLAPPGSIMGARMQPHAVAPSAPPHAAPPKPATKSANATPVPRKRPAAAPQEAAGSVEPLPAQGAAPAPALTPPVTPLE